MTDEVDVAEDQEHHLVPLGTRLQKAMQLRADGKDAEATERLQAILSTDPRLAEPRLELAHLAAAREDWDEAEAQARMAVDVLRSGGQWTADVPAEALLSFSVNLLAEVIYRSLQDSELIFTDRPAFDRRWNEAAGLFVEALRIDPSNEDARYWTTHVQARGLPEA